MVDSPEPGVACPCCGHRTELVFEAHPGYRANTSFDIYRCARCDTSQAHPLQVDPTIYEDIYRDVENVPAYERYSRYTRAALDSDTPLDVLADSEDVYWAIRTYLERRRTPDRPLTLLDAGSGLGYLTYALHVAGYDARGIDLSQIAVDRARAAFGDLFDVADVRRYAEAHADSFDIIVMTELVEHVDDVYGLLSSAVGALAPRGALVVTTPNKSSFAANALWATENPPVHLWWFSEMSMRALAERLDCAIEFVDFTEFNETHVGAQGFVDGRKQRHVPFFPVTLNEDGTVRKQAAAPQRRARIALQHLGIDKQALDIRHRLHTRRRGVSPRRGNMCAVFSKP